MTRERRAERITARSHGAPAAPQRADVYSTATSLIRSTNRSASPQPRARPHSAWKWTGVILIGVLIAHSCGFLFGVTNQLTYFIAPLQRVHPELYRHDWFASTTAYHRVFSIAASWLFRVDDSGALACAIAHTLLMTALVTAVFTTVTGVTKRSAFAVFAIVAAWLTINGDRSMAGSYLWSGYLQPSLLATVGWVIALAAYVRGRPLVTGIALAAGGLFHANFLVLGIGMFALAELISNGGKPSRRLLWLLAPQLIALAVLAPDLVTSARGADPELALWILVKFHAPGHYDPFTVAHTLPRLLHWVVLALVVAPLAESDAAGRLVTWCWIAAAICVLAVPVLMVPGLAGLTRLYVWRLAPFAQLAAMIVIAIAAVATIEDPSRWRDQPRWRRIAALVLAAWAVWAAPNDVGAIGGWAPAACAAGIVLAIVVPNLRAWVPIAIAVASLAIVIRTRWQTIVHPRIAVATAGFETDDLYEWARTTTPPDAVFLTPPRMSGFRLFARRAIVVDLKSPPLVPDELVEWYRRLCRVTGEAHVHDVQQANRLWNAAPKAVLLARARELGADYLVLDRRPDTAETVYASSQYAVYRVPR
jgi:hypothetical protein